MALVIASLQGVQPGSRLRGEQLAPACFQPAVSHALVVGTTPGALSMLQAVAELAGVVVGAGGFVVGIVAAAVPVAAIGAVLDDGAVGAEQVLTSGRAVSVQPPQGGNTDRFVTHSAIFAAPALHPIHIAPHLENIINQGVLPIQPILT